MELLPLEKLFVKEAADKSKFPSLTVDYVQLYQGLVNYLKTNLYQHIDTGLAANSSISGFYTAHNSEHFDEVVHYAGLLLGVNKGDEVINLNPYELYILLVAIRIHDAGNIHGREDHEKQCFFILKNCGAAGDDDAEKKIIAKIAQAHGGKTSTGDKDTIGELDLRKTVAKVFIRPRLIASIVRFADEICENRNRAANYLLKYGNLPKHSEIFHKYAASICANAISSEEHRLIIEYRVSLSDISKPWGCAISGKKTETFLIDEILDRLEKMDRERRYCNVYSREVYTINSIRATIEIFDDNHDSHDTVEIISVPELSDSGYPEAKEGGLKEQLKEYCGAKYYQKITQQRVGETKNESTSHLFSKIIPAIRRRFNI
jgi:hypothetical protein